MELHCLEEALLNVVEEAGGYLNLSEGQIGWDVGVLLGEAAVVVADEVIYPEHPRICNDLRYLQCCLDVSPQPCWLHPVSGGCLELMASCFPQTHEFRNWDPVARCAMESMQKSVMS
jgi:hypothetical protein